MKEKIEKVRKYYDNSDEGIRKALNETFGNYEIPDREVKFFKWLAKKIKNETLISK